MPKSTRAQEARTPQAAAAPAGAAGAAGAAMEAAEQYLNDNNIIGIQGIDTRALVRCIRDEGAMNGIISSKELDDNKLKEKLKNHPQMEGLDLAKVVSCKEPYWWEARN